jgi:formylglycine-generating enzyme required for sulfatase activity
MEMSGNLWERSVTVAELAGRGFTGAHGDGSLDSSGNANVSGWPGTSADAGFRGGSWRYNKGYLGVSARHSGLEGSSRRDDAGFRGVRTSP